MRPTRLPLLALLLGAVGLGLLMLHDRGALRNELVSPMEDGNRESRSNGVLLPTTPVSPRGRSVRSGGVSDVLDEARRASPSARVPVDKGESAIEQPCPALEVYPPAGADASFALDVLVGEELSAADWNEHWHVRVFDAGPAGAPVGAVGAWRQNESAHARSPRHVLREERYAMRYEVTSERQYTVIATGPGYTMAPMLIPVAARSGTIKVQLPTSSPPVFGTIEARIQWSGGTPSKRPFLVGVEDELTAVPLLMKQGTIALGMATFEVPAGRYRVSVVSDSDPWSCVWSRTEARVNVRPGATSEVTLPLVLSGRLRIHALGAARPEDKKYEPLDQDWLVHPQAPDGPLAPTFASVELMAGGQRTQPVLRRLHTNGRNKIRVGLFNGIKPQRKSVWALGIAAVSDPLSAGEYTLIARLVGGREIRQPVTVEGGKTVELRLDFGR